MYIHTLLEEPKEVPSFYGFILKFFATFVVFLLVLFNFPPLKTMELFQRTELA